jgi:hypothetical protein
MKWQADPSSGISYLVITMTAFYSAATEMNSLKEEAFLHKGETDSYFNSSHFLRKQSRFYEG